jgi:hypothetical protein
MTPEHRDHHATLVHRAIEAARDAGAVLAAAQEQMEAARAHHDEHAMAAAEPAYRAARRAYVHAVRGAQVTLWEAIADELVAATSGADADHQAHAHALALRDEIAADRQHIERERQTWLAVRP